ncbi:MAG TPA: YkgJ family cysteine cluster protein [Sedimentisphaerales bacterium]|nr:YkgJ family cysteine cluster protein [Sedimentisphaerales bacterium]
MAENLRTTVECKLIGAGEAYNCGTEVIGLELDILGKELNFHIDVGKGQARLADIVPLARTICTEITNVVVENIHGDGGHIPCCEGCAACCGPYLVPLSVPEVLRLKDEISAAQEHQRQSMFRACLLSAQRILSQEPPKSLMSQTAESSKVSSAELDLVSSWYASLKLTCPFLYNNVCTIYEQRPLACREHFVKGSADACEGECSTAEVVEMPVQLPNALAQLAGELEGTSVEAVILPLALVWCEQNPERAERTWPAVMMVKRFFEIVKAMASKNSTAVVA